MCGRRIALLVSTPLVLLTAAACMTWHHSSAPAPAALARKPGLIRIVRSDNSTIQIRKPEIAGDSIVGIGVDASYDTASQRIAVAVSDVKRLDVRGVSTGRTIALVGGLGASAILVAAAASSGPDFQPTCTGNCIASCPFVYSWDGHTWRLDSGTFGGAILPALARTDIDNLDFAAPQADSLRLRVTNELEETDHIDALWLSVVDHDTGVSVAPSPDGRLHTVGDVLAPVAAHDDADRDVLARIARSDGWGWESTPAVRDTTSEIRDGVTLVFPRPGDASTARLVLDANNTAWAAHLMRMFVRAHGRETQAWYDSMATDPRLARVMGEAIAREAFLSVSVRQGSRWIPQGLVWEAGPEVVKRQVIPLDLHELTGDSVILRLESAPGLWRIDAAGVDYSAESRLDARQIVATGAVNRRGRDVRPLIADVDGREYVASPGDTAEIVFPLPPARPGRARSYLLQSTGWYRIHTSATGEPDRTALARIGREPGALSRIATARLNDAVLAVTSRR